MQSINHKVLNQYNSPPSLKLVKIEKIEADEMWSFVGKKKKACEVLGLSLRTIEQAWCESFVRWYNHEHLHSSLKCVTSIQRHTGESMIVLQNRHLVYEKAKQLNPARWSQDTRNWTLPNYVSLNPNKKIDFMVEKQNATG